MPKYKATISIEFDCEFDEESVIRNSAHELFSELADESINGDDFLWYDKVIIEKVSE